MVKKKSVYKSTSSESNFNPIDQNLTVMDVDHCDIVLLSLNVVVTAKVDPGIVSGMPHSLSNGEVLPQLPLL